MFHLAPVGLPAKSAKSFSPSLCTAIERDVMVAVVDISENSLKHKIVYNFSHPDTKALLKSLDKFFSHGLNTSDKCYWCFVREFIPQVEQQDLHQQWNCSQARALSIAWLKDSLNKSSLYFQMLSFAKCETKLKAKWYNKGACMRNVAILRRICSSVESLASVEFHIEKPFVFRTEEVPIALPNTPIIAPVAEPMVFSPPLSDFTQPQNSFLSVPMSTRVSGISFSRTDSNSILGVSAQDLPAVNLPSSAHQPFLSKESKEDRDYMLDKMLNSHKRRMNGYLHEDAFELPETESQSINSVEFSEEAKKDVEVEARLQVEEALARQTSANVDALLPSMDEPIAAPVSENSFRSSDDQPIGDSANSLSEIEEGVVVDGEITLNSGEIVQLAMDVFRENVERFQRMFLVYTGHATGQPILRYLLITDQYIYFLSMGSALPEIEEVKPSSYMEATELYTFNDAFFDHKVKYTTHLVLSLLEVDHVTMGIDSQVLCLHLKKRRLLSQNLEHQNKVYGIETASKPLGKMIAHTLSQAITSAQNARMESKAPRRSLVLTNSTQLAIILEKFVRQEFQLPQVEILHHSLVYWQQDVQAKVKHSNDELESYLYFRTVNNRSWMNKFGEWQHSFFILRGCMLYQFSDSSCKFAQKSYNIRENVVQVFEADLKNEEKYVFDMKLMTEDATESIQFSCSSFEEMSKWMCGITLALSVSNELAMPVACMLACVESALVFAQEGANCLVDGWMRSLGTLSAQEVLTCFAVRTEAHNAVVVKRQDAICDWIFFRDEGELKRLIITLTEKWKLSVEDCDIHDSLYMQCIKVPDLWRDRN